jgi:2-polyprenyl-6-methoxyphenol hydroxylase-like FAD-dependent oxidoreductase
MTTFSEDNFDVVVYGAGPVGAAVALGLQQRGHRVCVCEKRSEKQIIGDAGKSINLSLSTRGRALLNEIGVYANLEESLVPMVCRRFPDGSFEKYREPLQSINRNVLTIKIIEAAQAAGVHFDYGTGFDRSHFDEASGEVKIGESMVKPRIVVGCDGVHGKVSKLINPSEAERSSRASEWGYYELNLSPSATAGMAEADFEHFHIWSGKGEYSNEFIVGLPNADKSITLTLFAPMDKMVGRYSAEANGTNKLRQYLGEAYDDDLDTRADGLEDAVAYGFQRIWLNDHDCIADEVGSTGTFVFLFGDAALGMEQFLGLAVNLGFEGVHRFLEHYSREGERNVEFYRGQARARNALNAGAKALQEASTKNAASMRDGCDDPLGKAVRAVVEAAYGNADIDESAFESTHDWWSFCTIPLKVCEAIVSDQDDVVTDIKRSILEARSGDTEGKLSDAETQTVLDLSAPRIDSLMAQRVLLIKEHHEKVALCF